MDVAPQQTRTSSPAGYAIEQIYCSPPLPSLPLFSSGPPHTMVRRAQGFTRNVLLAVVTQLYLKAGDCVRWNGMTDSISCRRVPLRSGDAAFFTPRLFVRLAHKFACAAQCACAVAVCVNVAAVALHDP